MYNKYDPIPEYLMTKIRYMSDCNNIREIPHFPLYTVTLNGQVWSVQPRSRDGDLPHVPRRMKPSYKNTFGLKDENRNTVTSSIARLLLISFVCPPPFEGANAVYLDGNLSNISLDNLAWLSEEERASRYLQRAGNTLPEHGRSKFTSNDIKQMKVHYLNGLSFTEIAEKYGITKISARNAVRGISWSEAGEGVPFSIRNDATGHKHPKSKLTEDQVREIKSRLANGEQQKTIAKAYGVTPSSIRAIAIGRNWKHIT